MAPPVYSAGNQRFSVHYRNIPEDSSGRRLSVMHVAVSMLMVLHFHTDQTIDGSTHWTKNPARDVGAMTPISMSG